jgi:hypothetical protein
MWDAIASTQFVSKKDDVRTKHHQQQQQNKQTKNQ